MARHVHKPILSPKIISIEQFVEEISNLDAASDTEQLFLLYQSYLWSAIKQKDDFYLFSKWARLLLQDFNEIDRYLVNTDSFFSYMSALKKIKAWNLNEDESPLITNYLDFWKALKPIYDDFKANLVSKNLAYQGLMYRKAFEHLESYVKNTDYKKFIFVGFNALNTAESEIIKYLLQNEDTEIYWDLDTYFFEDNIHAASFFIRGYRQAWPYYDKRSFKGISSNYLSQKDIEIIGVSNNISQAKYVGKLLKQAYNPAHKTALVLSDESLLQPMLNAIPNKIEEVNITMGKPLNMDLLYNFFATLIDMHIKKTERGFFYQEVLQLLANPYTSEILTSNGIDHARKIKSNIKKYNWMFIQPKHLIKMGTDMRPFLDKVFFDCSDSLQDFLQRCLDIIDFLVNESKKERQNSELTVIDKLSQIFNRLQEYAELPFIKDLKTIEQLYADMVSFEKLDYRGNPDRGLQVMGMLESRNLDFDTVIVTSVNEGILPSGKSNNSFIPYDVKREFKMPTYREKDAVYAYHFYRLLQRAKKIYVLYNTEPDVLEGGEKSRFITQMLTDKNINGQIRYSIASPAIKIDKKEPNTIQKTPVLIKAIHKVSQEGLSPTSLSSYIKDPLTFYKQYILKIKEPDSFDESMALNTFGTIVHHTLEELYKPFVGTFLKPETLLTAKGQIPDFLSDNFRKTLPGSDFSQGKNLIIYNVILKYLENFLDREMEQSKNHRIKILALEQKLSFQIQVPNLDFPLMLKGTLDRIDEKDGQLRIIDYKTGKVLPSELKISDWDELITEPKYAKAFQLLCYAKMYSDVSDGRSLEAGIIPIKQTKTPFLQLTRKDPDGTTEHSITKDVLQHFDAQLQKLVLEILDPEIPFVEKET
ncbi:PD-(D/E)XK nuclease family protein [Allomuricauda sp. d1]|uniref:PD-(D/E)XK nuclease family protein n=1 Tax=Allomuricauda sp. d1 TaxID=3136725 RepID=UPI0031E12BDB